MTDLNVPRYGPIQPLDANEMLQKAAPPDTVLPGEPLSPSGQRALQRLQEERKQERAKIDRLTMAVFGASMQANPKLAGEAQRLGIQTGLDPLTVERNIDKVRELVARQQAEVMLLSSGNPALRDILSDPRFARIAHDDLKPLDAIGTIVGNWRAGRLTMQRGIVANRIVERTHTQTDLDSLAFIERELAALPANADGLITGLARTTGQMYETSGEWAKGFVAGGTAGVMTALTLGQAGPQALMLEEVVTGPALALTSGFAGAQAASWRYFKQAEAGNAYREMVEKGVREDRAAAIAPWVGGINATLEIAGMNLLEAPARRALTRAVTGKVSELFAESLAAPAVGKFVRDYSMGVLGEIGTETLQEISNMVGEVAGGADPGPIGERLGEIVWETFKGVALLGAIAPSINLAQDLNAIQRVQPDAEFLQGLLERVSESKARERNPELFAESLQQLLGEEGSTTIYIKGSDMAEALDGANVTREQLDEAIPGLGDKLEEAVQTGGDVVLPLAQYAAMLEGTDIETAVRPHVRLHNQGYTVKEVGTDAVKAAQAEGQKILDEAIERDVTFAESAHRVEEDIRKQIVATGQLGNEDARTAAIFWRNWVVTRARRKGVLPHDYMAERPLTFPATAEEAMAGSVSQESLQQGGGPAFFSALSRGLGNLPTKSSTAAGWKQAIAGLVKKGAAKADEVEWTGLNDWLDMQEGKVSREAVLEFLRGNGVQVETVIKGGADVQFTVRGEGHRWVVERDGERVRDFSTEELATRYAEASRREWAADRRDVKFSQYTLPGGENYREVLLTLPERETGEVVTYSVQQVEGGVDEGNWQVVSEQDGQVFLSEDRAAAEEEAQRLNQRGVPRVDEGFRSGHFDEPNVLAHLRLTDRVDENGNRVLFAEEVQSDWAQKGRKEGFRERRIGVEDLRVRDSHGVAGGQVLYTVEATDGATIGSFFAQSTEDAIRQAAARVARDQSGLDVRGVPPAPFVENTQGWVNLALKRLLMLAVEGGYDKVAFISGKESAERYDLSKRVDSIGVAPPVNITAPYGSRSVRINFPEGSHPQYWDFDVTPQGIVERSGQAEINGKHLSDVLGKELADKVLSAKGEELLSGNDLRVGGEGMVAFYDKIVPTALRKLLKKLGGPDIQQTTIPNTEVSEPFNSVDITPELRAKVEEGLPLFQQGDRESRGEYFPRTRAILLKKGAKLDTVLHEMSHDWLLVLEQDATRPDAHPDDVQDFNILLDWWGVPDIATWKALPFKEKARHYEKFAYNVEVYLFDGKAPSPKLQTVFDKFVAFVRENYRAFRDRIRAIYKQATGEELPSLTDEVRGVMDRMLAAEDLVQQAQAAHGLLPMFQTREEFVAAGHPEAEWAAYQEAVQEAYNAAVREVTVAALKPMAGLTGATTGYLRKLQAEQKHIRMAVTQEVAKEVRERRVYRVQRFLREGVEGSDAPHRLDTDIVRDMVGEATTLGRRKFTQQGGLHPDHVAERFGYEFGREMLQDILEAPSEAQAIKEATDARMIRDHSEFTDPDKMQAKLRDALYTEAQARVLAHELGLVEGQEQARITHATARQIAKRLLAQRSLRSVRPSDFEGAAKRAWREAERAKRGEDKGALRAAKIAQLVQHHMAREAASILGEVASAQRKFRLVNKTDKQLAKTRNVDMVGAARAILAAYGLGPGPTSAKPHLDRVKEYAPEVYEALEPLVAMATENPRPYKDLTVEEFRVVRNTVVGLWNEARRDKQIRVDGKLQELEVAVQEIRAGIAAAFGPKDPGKREIVGSTKEEQRAFGFSGLAAKARHAESVALELDGGTMGPVTRYVFTQLREAFDAYMLERNDIAKKFKTLMDGLDMRHGQKIHSKVLSKTFQSKADLVGALLNSGNASNLRKFLLGEKVVPQPEQPGGPIDTGLWFRALEELTEQGWLTKEDWDFAQAVWDLYQSLWARTVQVHFEVFGFRPEPVEAQPIKTRFGTYPGGYVPVKYDHAHPDAGRRARDTHDPSTRTQQFREGIPTAGRGHTITRLQEYNKPLVLDLRVHLKALDDHLRFLHMEQAGRDVSRLLRNEEVSAAIGSVNPNFVREVFSPWLEDTLHNRIMQATGSQFLNELFVYLRRNTGMAFMFADLANSLQQLTGFAGALQFVELKHLKVGTSSYLRDLLSRMSGQGGTGAIQSALEESDFLRLRIKDQVGQIRDDIDTFLDPRWLRKAQAVSQRNAYFLQSWFQSHVDIVTWLAAKDHALAKGKSPKDGVRFADMVVRRSQSSATAPDISAFERSSPFVRLFTQFSSFWIAQHNNVMGMRGTDRAKSIIISLTLMGVVAGAITRWMRQGWDDEDGDGALWDDITAWAVGEAMRTGASVAVPVIGPVALDALGGQGTPRLGAPISTTTRAMASIAHIIEAMANEKHDLTGRDIQDIATLLTLGLGVPFTVAGRPVGYEVDVQRGKVEPTGPFDRLRGQITGRPSEASER